MENIFREDLSNKADLSVYKLVMLVTKRALEIAEGAPKLVDVDPKLKPQDVAMLEIKEGKVKYREKKE